MKILSRGARRLLPLLCLWGAMALANPAQARGADALGTEYPLALSVQIDPSSITDADLNEIRASGFEYVRFGVRPPIKSLDHGMLDYSRLIQRVKNARLEAIVTLFGGPAIWGNKPEDLTAGRRREDLFAEFATDFIAKHTGDVAVWEMWNEPDQKTFLKPELLSGFEAASEAFCKKLAQLKTQPQVVIGFGFAKMPFAGGKVPPPLENAFVTAARSDCLTDISIHPYRPVPETALGDYARLRAQLDQLQLKRTGIVASEWGYASYFPIRNRDAQASLVFREYLVNVAAGIKLLNLYAWRDRGVSSYSKEDNFGIMSKTGEKKEAFSALTEFLKIVRHAKKTSYQESRGVSQLVMSRDPSTLHVVWTQGIEQTIAVPAAKGTKCTRVDFFPEVRRGSCGNPGEGGFTVKANGNPVLLSLSN